MLPDKQTKSPKTKVPCRPNLGYCLNMISDRPITNQRFNLYLTTEICMVLKSK